MKSYIDYLSLSDEIDAENLFKEMRELEREAYENLTRKEEERRLVKKSRELYLTGKLVNFALTQDEWQEVKQARDPRPPKNRNDGYLKTFHRFYEEAEVRDKAIAENLLKAMNKHNAKTAVLVTGGFHGVSKVDIDCF